jgi:glutamate carboxypeptidase
MGNAQEILAFLEGEQDRMIAFLLELARAESPSTVPESQAAVQALLQEALEEIAFKVELFRGQESGGQLYARPPGWREEATRQLLLGHTDTVWPLGTLRQMPVAVRGNRIVGPGVYDMKAGLTQMVFALRALHALSLTPAVLPELFLNSDEETGSGESASHIRHLARQVSRVFVLEPSLGPDGKLKTARKGVGSFSIHVRGRAAHAGLDPEKGRSAIVELAYVIQKLHALNDPATGVTVNVGVISGGVRPNVVAAESEAMVDVRIPTQDAARVVTEAIRTIRPETEGVALEITGGINRGPLERTPRNQALWAQAQALGRELGLQLEEGSAGGASDGNITSQYAPTLDGLGAVGDGAHATHEFVKIESLAERAALLALLLLAPAPS